MAENRPVQSIQVLRGVAATMVVFHHAAEAVTSAWPVIPELWLFSSSRLIELGAAGVDIFFLISGFIMVYVSPPYRSAEKPVSDFLIRRLIRIYPMYAIVTSTVIAIAAIRSWRHPLEGFPYSAGTILASFAFVPHFNAIGWVQPIVGQGWTLICEMFFYLCFTAVLAFSKQRVLPPLIAIFSITLLLDHLLGLQNSAIGVFFSDPIIVEFLFGCAIGLLFLRHTITPRGAAIWLAGGVLLFAGSTTIDLSPTAFRFLWWGVPAAIVMIAFLKLEMAGVRWPRMLLLLGDASYSIYITHVLFMFNARNFSLTHFPGMADIPGDLLILLFAVVSIYLGIIVYKVIERPIHLRLSRNAARLTYTERPA